MKNTSPTFSFRKRALSFKYAFQGIVGLIRAEHNAWIHTFAAVVAVTLGFLLNISVQEWIVVIILIALVLAGEAFNSAIEALADHASDTIHPLIGKAKDFAAGGVLFLATAALIVGCIIFIPKILLLFS
ncbi:diacylglycerol kinase family protein [Acetobacteroides hydrogenigenes]|uniref:Diacylglycerol kinase (ATP) n=1 Tax=Acetobacteroides hydrogenigenes TaxID=979970 RepID=A0A4R2E2B1_9BACT|nr:diacylglycerol kinase family protein [Acetobacteroides hydrogenigenes]TCN61653.1 diacylglycerol kinase (ATP) [Acetobacteroides hydrogenigenes]